MKICLQETLISNLETDLLYLNSKAKKGYRDFDFFPSVYPTSFPINFFAKKRLAGEKWKLVQMTMINWTTFIDKIWRDRTIISRVISKKQKKNGTVERSESARPHYLIRNASEA